MNSYDTKTWAWEAQINALKSELDVQAAENARLRAALALFACDCTEEELCKFPHACRNYVARAALEDKHE